MSRHTDIPPIARVYGPDRYPAHREVLGHFEDGDYISYRSRIENEPYRVNFLDVISLLSLALIILLLGVAVGLWIVQGTLQ